MIQEVVLLGAGRLAAHLGGALQKAGLNIHTVYNRNLPAAKILGAKLGARAASDWQEIPRDKELYILAVSDAAISEVAGKLAGRIGQQGKVVHVSGTTPGTVFSEHFDSYGVFYPFQTFSAGDQVDFRDIPLCIWASNPVLLQELLQLAGRLSDRVYRLEDAQREVLHLAGVLANNFVNVLYGMAFDLLEEKEVPTDILLPLIRQTAQKVASQSPAQAQTGPAMRGDEETIDRHLAALEEKPAWKQVYQMLSDYIKKNIRP